MADRPFLTRKDVAELGGVRPETVSRALQRSKPGGPYASDPFPPPAEYNGQWPWWDRSQEQTIREWFARRSDRKGVGGRPRKNRD